MSTPRTAPRVPARTRRGRSARPRRSRPMQIAVIAVSVALLIVAALVFLAARGDDEETASSPKKPVVHGLQMTLGGVQNSNAGPQAALSEDAANQIMQVVGAYVDRGLITPASTGQPPQNVAELFDAGTQVAIQGPDKDVLFESGQPKRTGDFKPGASPVLMTALSDGIGQFVIVTAAFQYSSEAGVKGGLLKTGRNVALTLVPEGGQWKITGYDVSLSREGAEVDIPAAAAQR